MKNRENRAMRSATRTGNFVLPLVANPTTRRKVVRTCASTLRSRAGGPGERQTLTSRQPAGAGMRPTLVTVMHVEEVCIPFPVSAKNDTLLFTPQRLIAYLAEGIHEDDYAAIEESFWLIAMTRERRPILRQRLKVGHLVAARVSAREIFEATFDAGAGAIACVRVQHATGIQPGLADGRLLWNLVEASKSLNVLFVDYLITQFDGCAYYSYQEHRRARD